MLFGDMDIRTAISYLMCTIGFSLNLLLLYTILTKTPLYLRSFSVHIMNACLTDLVQCLVEGFAIMKVISMGNSIVIVPEGVCNYFGREACVAAFSLTMHGYCNIFFANTACFVFRWMILKKGTISVRNSVYSCLLLYIPAVCVFLMCEWAVHSSSQKYIHEISKNYPNIKDYVVFGVENWLDPVPVTYLFISIFSSPIHYTIMICMRRKVLRILDDKVEFSQPTRNSHKQLMKAITVQACLPPFTITAISIYGLQQMGLIKVPFLEDILYLWGNTACAIAPCVHLYFVRPYREAVKKMITVECLRRKKVTTTTTAQRLFNGSITHSTTVNTNVVMN